MAASSTSHRTDQPPHRHAIALARLLLRAGADPNDAQTLYNRRFEAEDDFLELLIAHGLGREQPGPWMRLLPDALESPSELVRGLLGWAVLRDQRDRVARLIVAGVDVTSPLSSRCASGRTPIEAALLAGHGVLADQLRSAGATEPMFGPVDAVVAAVLAGDRDQVLSLGVAALGKALRARPGLVVWAASQGGVGAVGVAVASGFGVNALARPTSYWSSRGRRPCTPQSNATIQNSCRHCSPWGPTHRSGTSGSAAPRRTGRCTVVVRGCCRCSQIRPPRLTVQPIQSAPGQLRPQRSGRTVRICSARPTGPNRS